MTAPKHGSPWMRRIRTVGSALTTPLLPDDYLKLIHPLWTARELRGRIERVEQVTDRSATLVIRPGWGWSFDYTPGQYIGIGVEVDGRFHWRSYSLSSVPEKRGQTVAITVKAMPEGFLSSHLVAGLEPGTIVRLEAPQGEFILPDPPPANMLFIVGGSGITPVMSMVRTMDRRGSMPDVTLLYSATDEADMMFLDELRELQARHEGFRLYERFTDTDGMLTTDQLDDVCATWRDRVTWACGPTPMLDALIEHYEAEGLAAQLHVERFSIGDSMADAEGGTITFGEGGPTATVDGATTLLEAGESVGVNMLFGCRMGICHTCDVPLVEGTVIDLRNGEEHRAGEYVQTCVSVAAGDCTLKA